MGPQEYQDALDALNSPDAPAPVKAAAKRLVTRYSSAMAGVQLKGRTADSLAETSTLGPTGLEAVQAAGVPTPEQADERARRIEKADPRITKALQLQAPALAPPVESGPTEDEAAALDLEYRSQFDNSLPNLSKRKDLASPTEWHPPTPANPQTPFDSVWGKLSAVKQSMPDWAGGGTEHYIEPSVAQFQLEMAPVLGPAVEGMGEGSDAFREYADKRWMMALQKAQAEGKPIIRDAFRPGAKGLVAGALDLARPGAVQKVGQTVRAGLIGRDEAMTGGILGTAAYMPHGQGDIFAQALSSNEGAPEISSAAELAQAYRSAREQKDFDAAYSPIAKEAGFALGAINPRAVGNVATEAALGARLTNPLVRGAVGGYVGGAATELAGDVPDIAFGDETLAKALERANTAGLTGLPLGIIGGALGTLARTEGRTLRERTPLGEAEKGGARVRPLRGVDPGPTNRGLEARARAEGVGEPYSPDVPGMLAHDLAEPFGKQAHARESALIAKGQPLREFEDTFAGETHPLKNTIQAILQAKKKLVQSDGTVASVNQPEMAKLDKLLDDIASTYPQAPEYRLEPKDPMRLDQLERAVDVHGELGSSDSFQRDVRNINEMSTPTRAITPQGERAAASGRAPLATVPDFGPYAENLPGIEGGISAGMAGERIRSLHEARAGGQEAFDVSPADARTLGLGAGGDDFVRMLPKGKNPADLKAIVAGVRQHHESGSLTKEPFPDYDKIKRAFHQDRDAFMGETGAIKQSDTFTLENGETVRGYSAANARLENETREFENFLDLLGFRGKAPDMRSDTDFLQMEGLARKFGQGGRSPEVDRAFREMAAETGMTPTLENLQRYRAMKELEQMTKFREVFRVGGLPSVGSLSGQAARLRLDPAIQALIPYLERSGSLGALPGFIEQNRELPHMADQATIDEIRRALQP